MGAEVQQVENPRQEDAENDLVVANQKFKLLGLDPVLLEPADGLFKEVTEITEKYLHRIDRSKVASIAYWNGRPRWRAAAARTWASRRPLCSVARWWPDGERLCLALGTRARLSAAVLVECAWGVFVSN